MNCRLMWVLVPIPPCQDCGRPTSPNAFEPQPQLCLECKREILAKMMARSAALGIRKVMGLPVGPLPYLKIGSSI